MISAMILKGNGRIIIPSSSSSSGTGTAVKFLLLVVLCFSEVSPANILFFHNVCSYSHRVATYPLASALANNGHNVTFLSPFPFRPGTAEPNPKIREIVPKRLAQVSEAIVGHEMDINLRVQKLTPAMVNVYFKVGLMGCQSLMSSPELKEFVNGTKKLDVIIADWALAECISPLSHLFAAKLVAFGSMPPFPSQYDQIGYLPESYAIPEVDLEREAGVVGPMGLVARVRNTLKSLHWRYQHLKYMSELDSLVREHLVGLEGMPHLDSVARNISLFLNSGDLVAVDYPRSLPPLFVNVAGLHCRAGKPLPAELEDFIVKGKNDSAEGFVYISLGSGVVASNLPEGIKKVFFSTMESFPKLQFLWKWNGDKPESYPKNLHLAKWYPQQDLLAHPKIRAFVSQTGRPSSLEAVYHAVPMISFPVLGDQDFNANRLNELGGNVVLELGTVTKEELRDAIWRTAVDSRIKSRMLELQKILLDRPMPPVETAVWWVEYLLRHKDTSHLRPAGFHQSWYQRRLLDVWGLLCGGLLLAILLLFKILSIFVKVLRKCIAKDEEASPTSSYSLNGKRAKKD